MKKWLVCITGIFFGISVFSQSAEKKLAYTQIKEIKKGIILVRLHTDEVVVNKMKELHQKNLLKAKLQEIKEHNTAIYTAFLSGFTFTEIRFFYSRNTDQIKQGNYDGLLLNERLEEDALITIPLNVPVYIIDVGDIYFEAFGGHFEGMVVMNQDFTPLKKPFPFYVRRRSGIAIIKRSDLDMVAYLQSHFDAFYTSALAENANN